jgi:integrase
MTALTALQTVPAADLPALLPPARHEKHVRMATAAGSRAGYKADFSYFQQWCAQRGFSACPALPAVLADYLSECADAGLRPATLARRSAAVRHAHLLGRFVSPTDSIEVRMTLRGIRRDPARPAPIVKAALTADLIRRMLDGCGTDLKSVRDRALLALGFAAALRRSELVALRVEDVTFVEDGLRLTIRRSKTDQEAQGHEIAVPHGTRIRPVRALRAWLEAAGITEGPLFVQVRRGGHATGEAIDAHQVGRIVKARCVAAGISPDSFSAHSLRSGFLTSGAMTGATVFKLKEVSRHKSIETLSGYVRSADLFADHAGSAFL